MKRQMTALGNLNTQKEMSLKSIMLPENWSVRLQELEIELSEGKLTHNTLKELFELYSKNASTHFEEQKRIDECNYFIMKMQSLVQSEKIRHLLERRKSILFMENMSLTLQDKKNKIDKIKSAIREKQKDIKIKDITSDLLDTANNSEKAELIMNNDLSTQEENFKKRLEERRMRGNSQPHLKLKSKLGDTKEKTITTEVITTEDKSTIKKQTTPPKRQSILGINNFGEKKNFKDVNMNIASKSSDIIKLELDEIFFDKEFNKVLLNNFIKVWEISEEKMKENFEKTESEIEVFLDDLIEEKYKRTAELIHKYDIELKELENCVNLTDVADINTIIYLEVKADKEMELLNLRKEFELKKRNGIEELRNKSQKIRNEHDKLKSLPIEEIKSDISNNIRSKIIKYIQLIRNKYLQGKNSDSDDSGENDDQVKMDSVKLNTILKKHEVNISNINKTVEKNLKKMQSTKRISRGFLSKLEFDN